ncbi:hypothetical protein [Hymenobacter glacieicola]|uniref:Uncharacterized protein n=1 Tax=Hymenobacter glacieicola TaxID=1562124 RepID=A0ABQ1X8R8_9BACT|nr:hypothetical protein [Hymenobacter glacieicola]GGG61340.1 hypothetical protein GCM10011378_41720 [Hymenobacter glacieicola]
MYTYLKPFLLGGRRFSRAVKFDKDTFFGFYKGCQLDISRVNKNSQWSIDVRHADGGYLYGGYYDAHTIEEALNEAITGAGI